MTLEKIETPAEAGNFSEAPLMERKKSKRREATPMQRELSEARPLLSAIALGLIFALTLTLAASLAPDTVGAKGGRISQPASPPPATMAPVNQTSKAT
ncbi:hypothetical protein [Roseibium litorale]|uniref:Uncharacterized protein n=1 Tax=Roseibium litorale TaxID=2803841 RepID=A0ABR9CIM8_9HYPH|nr:hypothetical protein [Roseibium litorale]MBD8890690.1 hypothetical protein [Roseibium litorale]